MAAHEILSCRACGRPMERGRRMRVDLMAERTTRNGDAHFRMETSRIVCPTCAWAVGELLRRMGGEA